MGEGGEFTKTLAKLSNQRIAGVPLLKFVLPFVKVGSNVARQAIMERSPLGVLDRGIRDNLMGRNGSVARDQQISRILVGSALGATTFGLAAQGLVTGSGRPTRRRRRPGGCRATSPTASASATPGTPTTSSAARHDHGRGGRPPRVRQRHGHARRRRGWTALMGVSLARNILNEGWMSGGVVGHPGADAAEAVRRRLRAQPGLHRAAVRHRHVAGGAGGGPLRAAGAVADRMPSWRRSRSRRRACSRGAISGGSRSPTRPISAARG